MRKDSFSSFHPVINFLYFVSVILFSMFFMHPVLLAVSLICGMAYSIYLNGKKAIKFNFLYMLPMMILVALINPIFNHEGQTIVTSLGDNPITAESIAYGAAASVMFVSVIVWFSCYNAVMTSDKFIYLFGRLIPALSLILSMVLRLVPKFKAQLAVISNAQKCIGCDVSNGSIFRRARNGVKIIFILITWSLENAIETADSMRSRGYGLKGRTNFSNYRFDSRDKLILAAMTLLLAVILCGAVLGENTLQYFPRIMIKDQSPFRFIVYFCYAGFCLLPLILNLWEDIKWRRLQSRI